mgnify:CR=1 FL=1
MQAGETPEPDGPQEDIIRMKRFRLAAIIGGLAAIIGGLAAINGGLAAIFGGVAEDPVPRLPSDLRDMQQRFPLMDQGIDPASDDHPGKAGLDLPGLLAQRV